jgi:mono/diheme cytochrome c family protein
MSPEPNNPAPPYPANSLTHLEDREETTDVSGIHAAVMREKADPREGMEPVSLWLIALTGVLLFWGGSYLESYSGGFKPLVYDENASGQVAQGATQPKAADPLLVGKQKFSETCQACHMSEGEGNPANQVPPLAGSEWVNDPSPGKIIRFVLNGLKGPIKVKGEQFPGTGTVMTPFRDVITNDVEIAAVMTFVRSSWGNKAPAVTADEVKTIRDKTKDRADNWTIEDVEKDVAASVAAAPAGTTAPKTPDEIKALLKSLPPDQLKQILDAVSPQK